MCSGARLALLVYGIIMHSSVYCSPDTTGLQFPGIRTQNEAYEIYDDEAYKEDQLPNFFDLEPLGIESPASASHRAVVLTHPGEMSDVAHVILNKVYRKVLDQLSRKKLLQKLVTKGMGGIEGSDSSDDDSDPLSKRHSDGIFTDSYSRYRKQMAVKKYLAAVLGKRYKQRVKNKGRRIAYL